jgi:hypothetical protein
MRYIVALMIFAALLTNARAHDYVTRDGAVITWYSGNGCCNGTDCRPIKSHNGVTAAGDLIVVTDDDLVIIVPKTLQRKTSKDLGAHVCAKSIETGVDGTAHCIFVPTEVNMSRRQFLANFDAELKRNICRSN